MGVVVESPRGQMGNLRSSARATGRRLKQYMSEAIPLRAALCVERVQVIEGFSLGQVFYLVLEGLSMEARDFWLVQW